MIYSAANGSADGHLLPPLLNRAHLRSHASAGARHSYFALTAFGGDESMSKFKIKMARIEAANDRADTQVCVTFQIHRGTVIFEHRSV
jgi:hypothetical protein